MSSRRGKGLHLFTCVCLSLNSQCQEWSVPAQSGPPLDIYLISERGWEPVKLLVGRANWRNLAGGGARFGVENPNSDRMSSPYSSQPQSNPLFHPTPSDLGVGPRGQMGRRLGWGPEEFPALHTCLLSSCLPLWTGAPGPLESLPFPIVCQGHQFLEKNHF